MAVIDGNDRSNRLFGTNGNDTIDGFGGNDRIYGRSGDDAIRGGDGRDYIDGGAGRDIMDGGAGNDRLYGRDGNDGIGGGDGNDRLWGGNGNDQMNGDKGNDRLWGGEGNDRLFGGDGNDRLYGDYGGSGSGGSGSGSGGSGSGSGSGSGASLTFDDYIDGGAGNDIVFGEQGDDTAVYNMAENAGARDRYNGGSGVDTLCIELTTEEWLREDVQADIAAYLAFLEANTSASSGEANGRSFQFTAFDLRASRFENLKVIVDSAEVDPEDALVTAMDDVFTVSEDGPALSGNVTANDFVPDLVADVSLISGPAKGNLILNADGSFTFDPNGEFDLLVADEDVTFSYKVTDADGDFDEATATITVEAVNDAPVNKGTDLSGTLVVQAEERVNLDLSGLVLDDIDANGGDLTLTLTAGQGKFKPGKGEPWVVSANTASFTGTLAEINDIVDPKDELSFEDLTSVDTTITATLTDNGNTGTGGAKSIGLGSIDIDINLAPIAQPDSFTMLETDASVSGNLLADNGAGPDTDPEGNLGIDPVLGLARFINKVGMPHEIDSGALVTVNKDGTFLYELNGAFGDLDPGETATDTFDYVLSDADGGQTLGTVTIDILQVNEAPEINETGPTYATFDGNDVAVTQSPVTTNIGNGSDDGVTLEGWFNWDGTDNGLYQILMHNGNTSTNGIGIIGEMVGGQMNLGAIAAGNTINFATGASISANTWYHIALTRENGDHQFYLNGTSLPIANAGVNALVSGNVTMVGGAANGAGFLGTEGAVSGNGDPFTGSIGEVRVWATARSQTEISNFRVFNAAGSEEDLVGVWRFDDGPGTDIARTGTVGEDMEVLGWPAGGSPVPGTPAWTTDGTSSWPRELGGMEDTPFELSGFSISDIDAGTNPIKTTFDVGLGTLTLADGIAGGVTASQITGNGTDVVAVTASQAEINTTLAADNGLVFLGAEDAFGATTLGITVNDQGNTGADPGTSGDASSEETTALVGITILPTANRLDGGSFEVPEVTAGNGVLFESAANGDWTFADPELAANLSGIVENGSIFGNAAAPEGDQVAYLQYALSNGGTISQTFTAEDSDYFLTFDMATRNPGISSKFEVQVDGVTVETITATNVGSYQQETINLGGLAPGAHTLEFVALEGTSTDTTTFLDNVVIEQGTAFDAEDDTIAIGNTGASRFSVNDLLGNDTAGSGTLTVTGVDDAANGIVILDHKGTLADTSDDEIIFAPNADFSETDSFTYTVTDGNGDTATATVTVTAAPRVYDSTFIADQPNSTGPNDNTKIVEAAGLASLIDIYGDAGNLFTPALKPVLEITGFLPVTSLGDDHIIAGSKTDELLGDVFELRISASPAPGLALAGADILEGGAVTNSLTGDAYIVDANVAGTYEIGADDILEAGPGTASLFGDNLFVGVDATTTLIFGNDILLGGNGDNFIVGDALIFSEGVFGVASSTFGNDILVGGSGDDTFYGDVLPFAANGTLTNGHDIFVFGPGSGDDTIQDFQTGTDLIDVSAYGITGLAGFASVSTLGGTTTIDLDGGGNSIVLTGIASVTAEDFIFA